MIIGPMTTGGMRGDNSFRIKNTIFFLSRRDGGTRRPPDFGRLRNPAAVFSLFWSLSATSANSSEAGER